MPNIKFPVLSAECYTDYQDEDDEDGEEDETDEDEEWTPGGQRVKAFPQCSGDRTLRNRDNFINYKEPHVPKDDHYYFCDECRQSFLKGCIIHGEPFFIEDSKVDLPVTDRARQTLPFGFKIKQSGIPNAGLGVFFCGVSKLDAGTHFGPYEGVKTGKKEAVESGYSWVVRRKKGHYDYIDAKDETRSNWMRYVNCARKESEQNLIAFQHGGQVLYRCCRPVEQGEELLVWYGEEYAKELGSVFDKLWDKKCSATGVSSRSPQTEVFACPECIYAFTDQLYLHKHMKRSHSDLYWQRVRSGQISTTTTAAAVCQPMSSQKPRPSTSQKQSTETTDVTTHGPPARGKMSHECKYCGKSFRDQSKLKSHHYIHTGERPFSCTECGKSFSQLGNLNTHWLTHSGEKPFCCDHCGKRFSVLCDLSKHERVHTGEKPFQCDQCERAFSQSQNLTRHKRSLHTGERPFRCKYCSKGFSSSGNLQTHIRVHTGEKPFQCHQCGRSFSESRSLKKHLLVHVKDNTDNM